MSDADHSETLNVHSDVDQGNESRNRYLKLAGEIADFALTTNKIKRVAIYGSITKQGASEPHDLDIVFMVDNGTAGKYLETVSKNASTIPLSTNEEQEKMGISALDYMGFDDEQKAKIKSMIKEAETEGFKPNVDINMVSDSPDPDYIRLYNQNTLDPNFLVYLTENALTYDTDAASFINKPIYSDETNAELKRSAFDRIKEVMDDPEYFAKLRGSLSFQRIIAKQKAKRDHTGKTEV